jgi:hypothetical protein
LNRLLLWVAETTRWLWEAFWEGFHIWLAVLALVICALVAKAFPCPGERTVRLIGLVLQLLGLITILLRLWATQRQFPGQWWRRWWQRRPRLRGLHSVISQHGAATGFTSGRARGRTTAGPQATFEQRVAMLEENYIKLFDEVGGLANELERRTARLSANLQAEASAHRMRASKWLSRGVQQSGRALQRLLNTIPIKETCLNRRGRDSF